jgi:hypothetical protein
MIGTPARTIVMTIILNIVLEEVLLPPSGLPEGGSLDLGLSADL